MKEKVEKNKVREMDLLNFLPQLDPPVSSILSTRFDSNPICSR
jgi:hypothetical protein